jgi:hypothetical protein
MNKGVLGAQEQSQATLRRESLETPRIPLS